MISPATRDLQSSDGRPEMGRKHGGGIRENRYFKTAEARKHTFSELADRYLRDVVARNPKQEKDLARQVQWWRSELGHYTLADLTPAYHRGARQTRPRASLIKRKRG